MAQPKYEPNPFKGGELFFNLSMIAIAILVYFFGWVPSVNRGNIEFDAFTYYMVWLAIAAVMVGNYFYARTRDGK